MELIVAFFITGVLIIVATLWNRRRFREQLTLQKRMETHFDTSGMNLSSSAGYKNCFSFQWVIDNLVNRTHGVYGSAIQDFLMDNTLLAVFVLGIILSASSMMIAVIFLTSIISIGAATAVIFVGLLVIMGPSEPKTSELLLNAIHKRDLEDLKKEDYVYVKLAVESIKKWLIISVCIGISFIAISPWAELLPDLFAFLVAFVSEYLIWNPALILIEVWFPLALLYITLIPVLLCYLIPKRISSILKDDEETV